MEVNQANWLAYDSLIQQAYLVVESEKGFNFLTDQDSTYWVYFTEADGFVPSASFASDALTFGFQNQTQATVTQNTDRRIMATILVILYHFLEAFPEKVLFYVCDDSGYIGKEIIRDERLARRRSQIFGGWCDLWHQADNPVIEKIDRVISLGGPTYVSCLFLPTHPCSDEIRASVDEVSGQKQP